MRQEVDLLIVGAGPAGMSAAIAARQHGLSVLVVDEQPGPGGQIWRNIENIADEKTQSILGKAYKAGEPIARAFRESGACFEPRTSVWQIDQGPRVFMTCDGVAKSIAAKCVLLATGAQERPAPFPGWTKPGVMTVGAGQILLKTSNQIPSEPVWIAGNGPLCLLYAVQLLKAGAKIEGFLDTTPKIRAIKVLPRLVRAVFKSPLDLTKGLYWMILLKSKVRVVRDVTHIQAFGDGGLEKLQFRTAKGYEKTVNANLLLVHEGVVPTIHPTLSIGCEHNWIEDQNCFAPKLDDWGETSERNIFVAGDSAGIAGVDAACLRGQISALGIAVRTGHLKESKALKLAKPLRRKLQNVLSLRPFLDELYRPRHSAIHPSPDTIACRCEEVKISTIEEQARDFPNDPNRVKAFTRAGMGPCQGRQCGYTVAQTLTKSSGRSVRDVGLYRVRPPLKPLTLKELATLDDDHTKS